MLAKRNSVHSLTKIVVEFGKASAEVDLITIMSSQAVPNSSGSHLMNIEEVENSTRFRPRILCGSCISSMESSSRTSSDGSQSLGDIHNSGYLQIHRLVDEGKKDELEILLRERAAEVLECRDPAGFTPLHRACGRGHLEIVKCLINNGADVRAEVTERNATPLHIAAEYGRESVISELLNSPAAEDINKKDHEGDTPLHEAALHGSAKVLEQLWLHFRTVSSDPPDLPNGKSLTLLHYAAGKGNLDAVQFLIDNGANKNACDVSEATPFHFAARCGSTSVMSILMVHPNDKSGKLGMTALHYAAWNRHIEAVEWLISNGASVHATDLQGNTPLHWAARKGSSGVIEILVKKGANVFAANNLGELPMGLGHESYIHDANGRYLTNSVVITICVFLRGINTVDLNVMSTQAGYATREDIQWLIQKIKDQIIAKKNSIEKTLQDHMTNKDNLGRTPMHWAAMKGNRNPGVVYLLAQSISDLLQEDGEQQRPLSLALAHSHIPFAEDFVAIKNFGSKQWVRDDFDRWATKVRQTLQVDSKLKQLLKRLTPPTPEDELINDMTPFYIALYTRKFEVAKFIQRHGTEDIVNERGGSTKRTALHWATLLNDRKIVSILCRGEDFEKPLVANAEDRFGKTALQYATEMKFRDIMKELMERQDVRSHLETLYRDRQLYVDAANAILVGAALIASVTFGGWLQPPIGSIKEEYPKHLGLRTFWAFNCLSFLFAIATVLAGASAVLPTGDIYIATAVSIIRQGLVVAAILLAFSIIFVVGAFIAAGFIVLPSMFKYEANMMGTSIAGGIPCILCLTWFLVRLYRLTSSRVKNIFQLVFKRCDGDACDREDSNRHLTPSHLAIALTGIDDSNSNPQKYKVGERYEYFPWDDGLDPEM